MTLDEVVADRAERDPAAVASMGPDGYRTALLLWKAASRGDNAALMALLDFYEDHPPPEGWKYRTRRDILDRVDEVRGWADLPCVDVELRKQLLEQESEVTDGMEAGSTGEGAGAAQGAEQGH